MKPSFIFPQGELPQDIQEQLRASLLTVSGLFPEHRRHIIMDGSGSAYTARFEANHVWCVTPLQPAYLPSAPFRSW